MSDSVFEPARSIPVSHSADVVVAGGGIAGVFAAMASGRSGARTLLVERLAVLGGNYGPGLGIRHDLWQHPSLHSRGLGGVVGEFFERLERMGGIDRFPFTGGGDSKDWSWPGMHDFPVIDNEAFIYLALKMLREAEVSILGTTALAGAVMDGNRIDAAIVENRSGRAAIRGKVFLDTTGDSVLAFHSGAPCDEEGKYGAGLFFQVEGVEWPAFEEFRARGKTAPLDPADADWLERVFFPALGGWRWRNYPKFMLPQIRRAWEAGEYRYVQDVDGICSCYMVPFGTHGRDLATVEACPQNALDPLDADHMAAAETRFRMVAYETVQFMKRYIPGFGDARIRQIASYLGSRGSRKIRAEYSLTADDIWNGTQFDDVVLRLTSLHNRDGTLVDLRHRIEGAAYELPYRQMLPRQVEGLLAAGRNLDTEEKKARLRARWISMLTGAVAGIAAALCAQTGVVPVLDRKTLQRKLLAERFLLGTEERLQDLDLL